MSDDGLNHLANPELLHVVILFGMLLTKSLNIKLFTNTQAPEKRILFWSWSSQELLSAGFTYEILLPKPLYIKYFYESLELLRAALTYKMLLPKPLNITIFTN